MMKRPIETDERLVELMRTGDEGAFAELYLRYRERIYRFAWQMSGNPSGAEDVVQDVFLCLIRQPDGFDPDRGNLSAFLYGVARNQVLRSLRAQKPYLEEDEQENVMSSDFTSVDPLAGLLRTETVELVRSAILTLPPEYRETIVLCDLHELSYQEAATLLGCAIGTIRSRLHRARVMLVHRIRATQERSIGSNPEGGTYELSAP